MFYPVGGLESQLRSSMRGGGVGVGGGANNETGVNKSNVMTDSTSSMVSLSSTTSTGLISWQHVQANDWNIEHVGSWLRSIGSFSLLDSAINFFFFFSNFAFLT